MYRAGRARGQAGLPALGSVSGGWGGTKVGWVRESLEFPLLRNECDGQLSIVDPLPGGSLEKSGFIGMIW